MGPTSPPRIKFARPGSAWTPQRIIKEGHRKLSLEPHHAKIPPMSIDGIVKELQEERNRIDAAIKALTTLSGSSPKFTGRRTLSASARRKISLAQKARWAKRASHGTGTATPKRT